MMSDTNRELDDLLQRLRQEQPAEDFLPVHSADHVKIAVRDIQVAVRAHPEHPLAPTLAKAVQGMPDNYQVVVERCDLLAVAEGRERQIHHVTRGDGQRATAKRLGGLLAGARPLRANEAGPPASSLNTPAPRHFSRDVVSRETERDEE